MEASQDAILCSSEMRNSGTMALVGVGRGAAVSAADRARADLETASGAAPRPQARLQKKAILVFNPTDY